MSTPFRTLRNVASALAVACSFTLAAHAGPSGAYWGGGSGDWLTTANWAIPTPDVPFNQVFSGSNAAFGYAGADGTVTIGNDISLSTFLLNGGAYDFQFNGHTLSVSGQTYLFTVGTFDFSGGNGSFISTSAAVDTSIGALTIDNYSASDVLRFGTSASGLSATDLSHITFTGYTLGGAAQIDANGYVTPLGISTVPESATYAGLLGLASLAAVLRFRRRRA